MIRLGTANRAVVLALAFLVSATQPAAAFTCQRPDPWFLESIALGALPSLPPGVFLRVAARRTVPTENEPPWDKSVLNWIEVENTTAMPLFLLEDAAEFQAQMGYAAISWADDDLGDVPPTMKTRLKSQSSTFYSWPYACAVVKCDKVEWRAASGPVMVTDGRWGTSSAFEDRIPRTKDRPTNAIVPSPQPGTITLSFERRTITVPFVVTYELNERYDPAVGVPSKECGNGILWGVGLLLLVVSAVVAAPIVIARRFLNARRRARVV